MRFVLSHPRFGPAIATFVAIGIAATAVMWRSADGATITASYESGYVDVSLNGYRAAGLGTFRLDDVGVGSVALCVEADQHHATGVDAYSPVPNTLASPELDVLIWMISRMPGVDADTGTAAAALAWYYSGALRSIGVPVWADGHRDFTPISPISPERWDALAPYGMSHLVGLRSGSMELDTAERRVAELFDAASHFRGPWFLDGRDGRFWLTGPSGPVGGQTVRVEVRDHTGVAISVTDLVTGGDGAVAPAVPALRAGGSVYATVSSPGVHREWDGDGDVQRLITATDSPLNAGWAIAREPGYLVVEKRSTDATIGVAGAVFALLSANDTEVARATTGSDGRATFPIIDPATDAGPYTVRELTAPPGLARDAPDQTISALGADPTNPTIVVMIDTPRTVPIQIDKRLSIEGAGPPDRTGFEFDIVRASDGWTTRVTTDVDGASSAIELPVGEYRICERDAPDWASNLIDGGCLTIRITVELLDSYDQTVLELPADARPPYGLNYVNRFGTPSISTAAHDPVDGDRTLEKNGGSVVDVVTLDGLVPGVSYVIAGELLHPDGTPVTTPEDSTLSTVTGRAEFTATTSSEQHRVEFAIPALPSGSYVIVERLWIGGVLIAEHADLTDLAQTIEIPAAATTTTTTTITTTTTTTSTTTTTIPTTATTTTNAPPASTTTPRATTAPPAATTTTTTTLTPFPATTIPPAVPPTLPATGTATAGSLLHLADLIFLVGIALVALTVYLPRRPVTNGA